MSSLRVGVALSVTGRFARFGTQAAQGLHSWRELTDGVQVVIEDDESDPRTLRARLPALAARCDLLLGPYSTLLARSAAEVAAAEDLLIWNHGGSGDDVQAAAPGHVVSVLSPTSRYAEPFVRHLAGREEKVPLVLAQGRGRFARQVIAGAQRHAERTGITTVRADAPFTRDRAWDLFTAGTFEEDVDTVTAARAAPGRPRIIGAVAAGVREFGDAVADSDGVLGVAQWFPRGHRRAEIGPSENDFLATFTRRTGTTPDYPAVQAAAAAALAVHCAEAAGSRDREALWAAATHLRTSTMFGDFAVATEDGSQVGHRMTLVRWDEGRLDALERRPPEP
ncbi:ABC transporter substrate-binding protein [Pseudonocardia alaniniphila]|uniref:ABC transporter substrate-binding protein n=1 Tax=Pseudonocardia alaniniphila TaxID=75291 RepID=A0ABS9TIR5_9PSEU|nr:ABC transporter substrate-binding protein [Pseudonocardia alaniniphila]MCH6168424.1 ABC transporter substrate-binding protein [Pseudonocardia alaniniphila]